MVRFESYTGRPQVYHVLVHLAGDYRRRLDGFYYAGGRVALAGAGPDYAVGYPNGTPIRIHVHESRYEVRIWRRRRGVQNGVHVPDRRVVLRPLFARVHEHVRSIFDGALVPRSRPVYAGHEDRPADRRCRVLRIILVPVGSADVAGGCLA